MKEKSCVYAYLRASTKQQDALRAKTFLKNFAKKHNLRIAAFYAENESGAFLHRPKLIELLNDCEHGDTILIESIDRLTRLERKDWDTLKQIIFEKHLKLIVTDIPSTYIMAEQPDELTQRIMLTMNSMLIDILAAVAHHDYVTRRQRQRQGIEKAKAKGKYKGRPADSKMHEKIYKMLDHQFSYREIREVLGVSLGTISRVKNLHADKLRQQDFINRSTIQGDT